MSKVKWDDSPTWSRRVLTAVSELITLICLALLAVAYAWLLAEPETVQMSYELCTTIKCEEV